MSSKIRPAGCAARGAMYTLRAGGNGSLPHEVTVAWLKSAISVDPPCRRGLRDRPRPLCIGIDKACCDPHPLLTRFRRVATRKSFPANNLDEVLLRIGPAFLQRWAGSKDSSRRSETATLKTFRGKTSQERLSPRNTRKGGKGSCDFNAILSCVSCLSWLTQFTIKEPSGDVTAYAHNGDQCTLDGPISFLRFTSRHVLCFSIQHAT